jgi:osmotically-inducible protein OsmY
MRDAARVARAAAWSVLPFILGCQATRSGTTVKIPAAEAQQDEALSNSLRDRLLAVKNMDLTGVRVVCNGATVYLTGTVKSLEARQQAVKIAWDAPGVQSVVNSLEVQR